MADKKLKQLNAPAAAAVRYYNKLLELITKMTHAIHSNLYSELNKEALNYSGNKKIPKNIKEEIAKLEGIYSKLFFDNSFPISSRFVQEVDGSSKSSLTLSLSNDINIMSLEKSLSAVGFESELKSAIDQNVELIKSIPTKHFEQIKKVIFGAFETGEGLKEINEHVQSYVGVTQRRANFIAEDQTRKVFNTLNIKRMSKSGIQKFEWIHSGGGMHPREMHVDLDGQVFDIDDPPEIDEDGTTGFPGDLPNCRCTSAPVIDTDTDDSNDSSSDDDDFSDDEKKENNDEFI